MKTKGRIFVIGDQLKFSHLLISLRLARSRGELGAVRPESSSAVFAERPSSAASAPVGEAACRRYAEYPARTAGAVRARRALAEIVLAPGAPDAAAEIALTVADGLRRRAADAFRLAG